MCLPPVFAWEAYDKGSEVHLQADPTKLELLHQSFKVKKEDFKQMQKESILERVKGKGHIECNNPIHSTCVAVLTPNIGYAGKEKACKD